MNIVATSEPFSELRNAQVGDWTYGPDDIVVKSAVMSDWRRELLVQVHELCEAAICKHSGITDEQVTAFDALFEQEREFGLHPPEAEDGDDSRSPYRDAHFCATNIERILATALQVDWKKYEEEIYSL